MQRIMQIVVPTLVCAFAMIALKFLLLGSETVIISKTSRGMRPAIGKETEKFTIDRSLVRRRKLKQGDIVAYKLTQKDARAARVIALAGDRVSIKNGKITVNGRSYKVSNVYVMRTMNLPEIRIPRDCVYLLADVRGKEADSWKSGPIALRNVLGKMLVSE